MRTLKITRRRSFGLLPEQNQQLLSNDRQHFNVNTIELVKATPCTSRCQSFKEFTDHNVIHGVRAVKHNTLFGKGLCKILS